MTKEEATDATMRVIQEYVDKERLKIWDLNKEWREKAERFIEFYVFQERNSPSDSLNQVYAKGPFAGGSVRSVRDHAKDLLKENSGE